MGVVLGLMLACLMPSEPAYSQSTGGNYGFGNGSDKFAMVTVQTQNLGMSLAPDAVFILDFLTGRLYGAALNGQTAKFTQFYGRSVMDDFGLSSNIQPKFLISPGQLNLGSRGQAPYPAQGGLYIAELTSGKVNLYAFPYVTSPNAEGNSNLALVDSFTFREKLK
jgi:hypothetical protein